MAFFQKRRDRNELSKEIIRLKKDFSEEIGNFEHFKGLQQKKEDILNNITSVWNKRWKIAKEFFEKYIPNSINKQINYIKLDLKLVEEEDFLIANLISLTEERETSIVGVTINNNLSAEQRTIAKSLIETENLELKRVLEKNSIVLKQKFIDLNGSLVKQLKYLKGKTAWQDCQKSAELMGVCSF